MTLSRVVIGGLHSSISLILVSVKHLFKYRTFCSDSSLTATVDGSLGNLFCSPFTSFTSDKARLRFEDRDVAANEDEFTDMTDVGGEAELVPRFFVPEDLFVLSICWILGRGERNIVASFGAKLQKNNSFNGSIGFIKYKIH